MRRKTRLTITSLLLAFTMFSVSTVNIKADAKNEVNQTKKASDYEGLKDQKQVAEYGTPEQLSEVHSNTMSFIKKIAKKANESALANDLYASVTIAQAIVESGNGESGLSLAPYNNLFGIKGSYNGNYVSTSTGEDDGSGNWYNITASFAVYPSWDVSIEAHDELLAYGLDGYYHGAWKSRTSSYAEAAMFLQERYASDTVYGSKLISVIERYNLTRFDKKLSKRDIIWLESDSLDPWELPIDPLTNEEIDKKLNEAAEILIPKKHQFFIEADQKQPTINDVKRIKDTLDTYVNLENKEPKEYIIFNDLISA